jgi:hypothetical protein
MSSLRSKRSQRNGSPNGRLISLMESQGYHAHGDIPSSPTRRFLASIDLAHTMMVDVVVWHVLSTMWRWRESSLARLCFHYGGG